MKLNLNLQRAAVLAAIFSARLCASRADVFTVNPFSDAFVATGTSANNLSGNNFGGGGALTLSAPGLPNGEFQTVMQFNLSGTTTALNTQFGTGNWAIQSVILQLTATPHGNVIYNSVAAGQFNISLMQNNTWTEGTGTAGLPTTDGISYNSLQNTYLNNATDQALGIGSFNGGMSGNTSTTLTLTSGLIGDLTAGGNASIRLYADDSMVSFLFSSRSDSSMANRPELIIDASAIPEPGSLALCAMGLAAFLFWRRIFRFA